SFAFWRWSEAPSLRRAIVVALAVGVAVATRLTGWLLLPAFTLIVLYAVARAPRTERPALGGEVAKLAAAIAIGAPLLVWAAYGFRYAAWPGETVAQAPGPWLGRTGRAIAAMEAAHVLPEAYLEGARFVAEHNTIGHPTYLLGKVSTTGWPHYYLVAFVVKNTPGFLLALGLAAAGAVAARRNRAERPPDRGRRGVALHWLLPPLITFTAASLGRIQIGEGYILPMYPYLGLLPSP